MTKGDNIVELKEVLGVFRICIIVTVLLVIVLDAWFYNTNLSLQGYAILGLILFFAHIDRIKEFSFLGAKVTTKSPTQLSRILKQTEITPAKSIGGDNDDK